MKKVIFGVLALIFAIAVVTGGYMLITSRTLQKYAVEDVSCPYSWQELRSGTYRLEIDTTAYPDHNWGVEGYPKNVVAASEANSENGTMVFSILPLNMGQTYVQVYCEQTEPFAVRVFEIGMQISVSDEGEITVEKTEHREYAGITTAGEGEENPIQWWTATDGAVNLLITQDNGGKWAVVDYDPDSLDVSGPFFRQGSCGFEIQGKMAGAFPMTIHDGGTKAICLEVTVNEKMATEITGFAVDTYTVDRSEEHTALETVVGRTLALPQQAVVTGYSVWNEGGTVEFLLNDGPWRWQIELGSIEEELIAELAANASEAKSETVGDTTLSAYSLRDGVTVLWNDESRMMALYGEAGVDLEAALTVAGQIVEENDGQ